MLTEQSVIDQMTVDELGRISVRRADRVLRDGEVIASTYHRHVVAPGDPVKDEDPRVAAVAKAVWTPAVIAEAKANK